MSNGGFVVYHNGVARWQTTDIDEPDHCSRCNTEIDRVTTDRNLLWIVTFCDPCYEIEMDGLDRSNVRYAIRFRDPVLLRRSLARILRTKLVRLRSGLFRGKP